VEEAEEVKEAEEKIKGASTEAGAPAVGAKLAC